MAIRLRIATFNLENLDDKPNQRPTLDERIAVMRPQLLRINADILCLQEVSAQASQGQPRQLLALNRLLQKTPYAEYNLASTMDKTNQFYSERNLVILSRLNFVGPAKQYLNQLIHAPAYQQVTAHPPQTQAHAITWERPILHAQVKLPNNAILNIINVHLKSKIPTNIDGQKEKAVPDNYERWKSISGWAEGSFLSTLKRVGQALEVRKLIDNLFDADSNAFVLTCGDFNDEAEEVSLQAIRGDVENTENVQLAGRIMIPCERTIPEPARFSLLHQGKGIMLDHLLISRPLLPFYRETEIHNEILHDESLAFADDKKYPESDHAPVVAEFELPG